MGDDGTAKATPAEWATVKDLRLRALAESPGAFGSTLAAERRIDDETWRHRVADGHWFVARRRGRPIGLVAGFAEADRPEERHLVSMWVEPAERGTAAATDLVEAVCAWAEEDGAVTVGLWVADGNDRARRFYERLRFRPTGERQPLPSAPEVGEQRMTRPTTRTASGVTPGNETGGPQTGGAGGEAGGAPPPP